MTPAAITPVAAQQEFDISALKANAALKNGNGVSYADKVVEDYEGNYQFAPIEEAEVSRAMIKRYVGTHPPLM